MNDEAAAAAPGIRCCNDRLKAGSGQASTTMAVMTGVLL